MYYLRFKDDKSRQRWKVREAVSLRAAVNCINFARVSGSVGGKDTETKYIPGVPFNEQPVRVLADVVKVNDDLSERQPS